MEREHDGTASGAGEYHLHTELAHELKELGRHPVEESRRLLDEAREGEVETTPAIVIAGVGVWLVLLVVLVIGLSFGIAYALD